MKITAITRYKHGEVWEILQRLGWSQRELANRAGLQPHCVGSIINLTRRPSREQAEAIQRALGEAGEYFDVLESWPESFAGLGKGARREETIDVPMEHLLDCREAMTLPALEKTGLEELARGLDLAMKALSERERSVVESRFFEGRTHASIGKDLGVGGAAVHLIESRALRKLRHPARARFVKVFSNDKQ